MTHTRIDIEHVKSGQGRPYADTINIDRVTVLRAHWQTGDMEPAPDDLACRYAKQIICPSTPMEADVNKSNIDEYFRGWCRSVEVVEPGVVEVVCCSPYTD